MCNPNLKPGAVILEKREELGWSQVLLAKKVGVSPCTVGRIEKGQSADWLTIVALLQAVGAEVIVR